MTHKHKLTISIVTYNNETTIAQALDSIENSTLTPESVIVVDNSSHGETADLISNRFPVVTLIPSENIGFGAGHNKAIRQVEGISAYHLVMNPDVYFDKDVLERLVVFMDEHPKVGLVMPRILYPDESVQHLCKLLPTPFDLIGRRFIPGFLKPLFEKQLLRYEMRYKDYNRMMEVPHLSGCFMLLRTGVFREVGRFDERFFMYLEDVDFSRRIHARFKTVYFPEVHIYHQYHKGSYKRWRYLKHHVVSAVKYFNKWGWFYDKERKEVNRAVS